jgi:hypothetical protein
MRGGKREGAGRPTNLDRVQVLRVGEEFERLLIKATEDQAMAKYKSTPTGQRFDDLRRDVVALNADPDGEAKDEIEKMREREEALRDLNAEEDYGVLVDAHENIEAWDAEGREEYEDDVDGKLYRATRADAPPIRLVTLKRKRAYDVRPDIEKAVVAWCQAEFGHVISASKAVECWKEYKRFQRRFDGTLIST